MQRLKQFITKRSIVTLVFSLVVVLASIPAIYELTRPGYYTNHDGEGHIIRLQEFDIALKEGHFPPRMDKNLMYGYGYYFFNYNYPLVYWVGEAAHAVGFSYTDAVKVVSILGLVLSGVAMFWWQRNYWGIWGALTAAVFYVYTPYRLMTVYVRGALAEHLAFVMLPLLFYFTERVAEGDEDKRWRYVIWGGVSYALLMLSHNIMAFIFSIMLGAFMLFHAVIFRSIKLMVQYVLMIVLGMGLSAYFWLPAIMEKGYVRLDQTIGKDYPEHFVYWTQLLQRSWGFGGSGPGLDDGLSFQVGVFNVIFLVLAVPAAIYLWRKVKYKALHILLIFVLFAGSVFFMLPVSKVLWDNVPLLPFTQFPWRFLSWSTFTTSILAGMVVFALRQALGPKLKPLMITFAVATLTALVGTSQEYWQVNQRVEIKLPGDQPIPGSTTWADEQFPKWFEPKPTEPASARVELVQGSGEVTVKSWKTAEHRYKIISEGEVKVVENTAYFPGWELNVDGKEREFSYEDSEYPGRIVYTLDEGMYDVTSRFTETPLRTAANAITLGSLGVAMSGFMAEAVVSMRKRKEQN